MPQIKIYSPSIPEERIEGKVENEENTEEKIEMIHQKQEQSQRKINNPVSRSSIKQRENIIQEKYSDEEINILAKLVYAEANNQPYEGKIAIVNVVTNRIEYYNKFKNSFAGTIKEVVFANNGKGTYQFPPVNNGSYDKAPILEEYREIVKTALSGTNVLPEGTIFFVAKGSENYMSGREYATTIGDHIFYKK